jgi:hypothetical protein
MNITSKTLRASLTTGTLLGPATAFALPVVAKDAGYFVGVVCEIAYWVQLLAFVTGVIYAVIAAYKYMTSGGDASKVSEAHQTLTWAAVGIGVAIIAAGVPNVVFSLLNSGSGAVSTC